MQHAHAELLPNPEFMASIKSIEEGVPPVEIKKVKQVLDMASAPSAAPMYTENSLPSAPIEIPQVPIETPEIKPIEPRPIVLTYKFDGDCKTCMAPVDTILLETHDDNRNKKIDAVAWCNHCRKQLANRKVTAL